MGLPGDRQVCSQAHENTTTTTTNLKTGVMMVVPVTLVRAETGSGWSEIWAIMHHESIMETNLQ